MSVVKASLIRRAVLTLVAGAALAAPMGAKADLLGGLSIRAGFFHPIRTNLRDLTDFAQWGVGVDYKVPWIPTLFTGEHWATSISADFHYSQRRAGIFRYYPVSINQVYTFEEQNGHTPYAGFCFTAATFGTTGVTPRQPMVTRFGGGLILGLNVTNSLYFEGRYEWFDKHGAEYNPEGFRGYVGWRF
jgi:hypothetical protein